MREGPGGRQKVAGNGGKERDFEDGPTGLNSEGELPRISGQPSDGDAAEGERARGAHSAGDDSGRTEGRGQIYAGADAGARGELPGACGERWVARLLRAMQELRADCGSGGPGDVRGRGGGGARGDARCGQARDADPDPD